MRNADTILGVIRECGRRRLPLENIYRQLYNRNLSLQAYGRLYRNDGAMTCPSRKLEDVTILDSFPSRPHPGPVPFCFFHRPW
jgi:hypothetical protein